MKISKLFVITIFYLTSIFFGIVFGLNLSLMGNSLADGCLGAILGLFLGFILVVLDHQLKKVSLFSFNVVLLGLGLGYLMGLALSTLFGALLEISGLGLPTETLSFMKGALFLLSALLGMTITARSAEDLYVCFPFVRFQKQSDQKRDILIDSSLLADARIIDLATSGLLDHHLILPRFVLGDLQQMAESEDEAEKSKARRCLDVLKKLESIPTLHLRYSETDFPDIKDGLVKLIRLARLLDAMILTADMNRLQESSSEGVRLINIHALANLIKPITQAGEFLKIKIQRYGKEARQGIGYLDDGTMVVVNGGAEFIGESIKALVLSVKHTTAGRMIFCNAIEGSSMSVRDAERAAEEILGNHRAYINAEV